MNEVLKGQRVLLRADLNLPMKHGTFTDDFRLRALLPTLDNLQKEKKIILVTHLGRPKQKNESFSTKQLIPLLQKYGYSVEFEDNLEKAYKKSFSNPETILLLENLRFFPGEQNGDPIFAEKLARLGDTYINDAFGVIHRTDCSIIEVPKLFSTEKRSIGPLVEKELTALKQLKNSPQKPFLLILGGAKLKTKIPLIKEFIGKADTIILCPALVFSFLKALGKPVGKSLVDDSLLLECKKIVEQTQKTNTEILFPVDYQIAHKTFDGPTSLIDSIEIPSDAVGISIGKKTEKLFAQNIAHAKTIFFNGAFGNPKKEKTLVGLRSVLSAMSQSNEFTVIGGGDTVALAEQFGLSDKFSFCSTGGGATLAYLADEKLPALDLLLKHQ